MFSDQDSCCGESGSAWPAGDQAESREARSDALAATQKEFRDGVAGNGEWTDPYYWAAWQLVGDWRPIKGL